MRRSHERVARGLTCRGGFRRARERAASTPTRQLHGQEAELATERVRGKYLGKGGEYEKGGVSEGGEY